MTDDGTLYGHTAIYRVNVNVNLPAISGLPDSRKNTSFNTLTDISQFIVEYPVTSAKKASLYSAITGIIYIYISLSTGIEVGEFHFDDLFKFFLRQAKNQPI